MRYTIPYVRYSMPYMKFLEIYAYMEESLGVTGFCSYSTGYFTHGKVHTNNVR